MLVTVDSNKVNDSDINQKRSFLFKRFLNGLFE
jgi:hypothetical protein